MDNGGLRYGANGKRAPPAVTHRHSSRPSQADPSLRLRRPEPRPLDPSGQAKHHPIDPRKQTPGGRHQIGTPAGFKSESVAGFLLECVAGFVGIRNLTPLRRGGGAMGDDKGMAAVSSLPQTGIAHRRDDLRGYP